MKKKGGYLGDDEKIKFQESLQGRGEFAGVSSRSSQAQLEEVGELDKLAQPEWT
jgi:hypothetical protein